MPWLTDDCRPDDGLGPDDGPHELTLRSFGCSGIKRGGLTTGMATSSITSAGTSSAITGILPLSGPSYALAERGLFSTSCDWVGSRSAKTLGETLNLGDPSN